MKNSIQAQSASVQVTEIIQVTPQITKLLSVQKRIDRLDPVQRIILINLISKSKPLLTLGLDAESKWIVEDFISIISELPMMKKRAKYTKK